MSEELEKGEQKYKKWGNTTSKALGFISEVVDVTGELFGLNKTGGESKGSSNPADQLIQLLGGIDKLSYGDFTGFKDILGAGTNPVTCSAKGFLKLASKINNVGKDHGLGRKAGGLVQKIFSHRNTKRFLKKYNENVWDSRLAGYLLTKLTGAPDTDDDDSYAGIVYRYMSGLSAESPNEEAKIEAALCATMLFQDCYWALDNARKMGLMLNNFCSGLAAAELFENTGCVSHTDRLRYILENDRKLRIGCSGADLSMFLGEVEAN